MSVVINTNAAATSAAINFSNSNTMLQKSLARLSSGNKIINPSDDAGGLAVSMKMQAAIKRTAAVQDNIGNATSYLQTQDGALKTIGSVLDRMSELSTLYSDVTKSTSDKTNYATEFTQLQAQLASVSQETFNGVSLFGSSSTTTTMDVKISEDGSRVVTIDKSNLTGSTNFAAVLSSANTLGGSAVSLGVIKAAIEDVATFRAKNGAYTNRLAFANDVLTVNKANLESANSRIMDVDVASESTAYAKYNILVQSGASMLAQANSSAQIALKLLQG